MTAGNSAGIHFCSYSGFDEVSGQYWIYLEVNEGAYGGRHGKDAMDSVDNLMVNTRNNPIEDIESHVPLRVLRYELRDNACAPGEWRGGLSMEKEVEYLSDGGAAVEGEGHRYAPWGFEKGGQGYTADLILKTVGGEELHLPSKVPYQQAKAGDRFVAIGAAGGGTTAWSTAVAPTVPAVHSVTASAPHFVLPRQNNAASTIGSIAAKPEKAYWVAMAKMLTGARKAIT